MTKMKSQKEALTNVDNIVNKEIESKVIAQEKSVSTDNENVLILSELDCVSCAWKIEDAVKKLPEIMFASLNFATKELSYELVQGADRVLTVDKIHKIVKSIEPEATVIGASNSAEYNSDDEENLSDKIFRNKGIRLALSGVVFAVAILMSCFSIADYVTVSLYIISYLFSGGTVLLSAGRNILKGRIFDENFLISVATLGAFAINYFDEGVAVMLFFQVGMYLQSLAAGRSRRSITALMDIRPDTANLKIGNEVKTVSPCAVKINDVILVKPGEKIPLDGVVLAGVSMVDTSALTGESVPHEVLPDSEVLAGFVNKNRLLTVRVSKEFGQSTVSKIIDMMHNAGVKKAPTENFITTFARYYTPFVTAAALLIAIIPPLFFNLSFTDWVYRALVFLVISCPCALVLSIPLGFFGGIGAASKIGVLVKSSNYFEALHNIDTMVFDKTGTLTKGVFEVAKIQAQDGFEKDELLRLAALAEVHSNHPIAVSIRKAYGQEINVGEVGEFEEFAGYGTKAVVNGKTIIIGNLKLMNRENIDYQIPDAIGTTSYIAIDERFAGTITISDQTRPDSADTMKRLKEIGVKKLVMLTGDNKAMAEATARELGFDAVYSELLPDQKVSVVEDLLKEKPTKGKLVFVGDGINDAPVLARADIGIAMGGLGSDAAIEAADVVLMTDEPKKILGAIGLSRKTKRIVWQNIVFSLGVKAAVLLLGALGLTSMWAAVFADVGVALLAVLNSLRVMKVKTYGDADYSRQMGF